MTLPLTVLSGLVDLCLGRPPPRFSADGSSSSDQPGPWKAPEASKLPPFSSAFSVALKYKNQLYIKISNTVQLALLFLSEVLIIPATKPAYLNLG